MNNNKMSRSEKILFELSKVSDEVCKIGNQFNLLEINDIENALKRLKETLRYHNKPKSDTFSVTI